MSKNEFPIYIINAFTNSPFSGNPAAVCLINKQQDPSDQLKQKLATEMDLSETAFVMTQENEDDFRKASKFGLRWFTPVTEVVLCGHATLASAAALFNCVGNINQSITFETLSGPLVVQKSDDGKIIMELPINNPLTQDEEQVKNLIKIAVGTLPYQDIKYSPTMQMFLIRLDDKVHRSQFECLMPPANLLLHAHDKKIIGVIVTLKGTTENGCVSEDGTVYDFVSRFFAPWVGTAEDPVTGSAHTVLGPYWADILNKKKLFACQCSKRKGELWLDVTKEDKVIVTGDIFIFIKGSTCIQ